MPAPLRKRRRGWIAWLVVLVVLVGAGVAWTKRRKPPATTVRVHRVAVGRVRDLVSSVSTGRVSARREANLRAEIAGRILRRHHERGDRVAAGEVLYTYDSDELRTRVRAAQAGLAVARAQTAQAEASARVTRRNAERATSLATRGATAPAEAETLTGQADVAERTVASARSGVHQAEVNIGLAQDALRHAVVRAPFAGIVLTIPVEAGEVTAPGTPLATLADTTSLRVDADLDEADLGRVSVGMRAEVSLDAFPDDRFTGTLTELAPSVTQDLRGNRSLAMRVELNPDPRLRVGMSADVDVIVATRESVLSVPPNAVLGRGTDRAVFLVEGGVARRRSIEVGIATWEAVEVRRGVRAGDLVVISLSGDGLTDGARVTPRVEQAHRETGR